LSLTRFMDLRPVIGTELQPANSTNDASIKHRRDTLNE
jgi:hypothetical protein